MNGFNQLKAVLFVYGKIEAELQRRLSMDPLEAYQRKTDIPFKREPIVFPSPQHLEIKESDEFSEREQADNNNDDKHSASSQ